MESQAPGIMELIALALAMVACSGAAPNTNRARTRASTEATAPARGVFQFSHIRTTTRKTTGEAASSQLMMVSSGL